MKNYEKLLEETKLENNQVQYETYWHLKNFQSNKEYKTEDLHIDVYNQIEKEGFEVVYFQNIDKYGFKIKVD